MTQDIVTKIEEQRNDLPGVSVDVQPIRYYPYKMMAAQEAGATVFLVPAENCDEARTAKNDAMELVKVATLDQAVDSLHTLTSGGRPPSC